MGQLAQGHRSQIGLAKNIAEGTPNDTPEWFVPVYEGGWQPAEDRQRHEVADGLAFRPGGYKARADAGGGVTSPVFPDPVGRLCMALLGQDTITGAADPWSHEFIRAATRPFHTGFRARPKPDGTFEWERFDDLVCKTLEFQWATGQPLRVMHEWVGKKSHKLSAAPVGGTIHKLDNREEWLHSIGAILKVNIDDTPASVTRNNMKSCAVRLSYENMVYEQTDQLTPSELDVGLFTLSFSAEWLVKDYELYLATFYGAKDAADVDQSIEIPVGSADLLFPVFPANADHDLQVLVPALELRIEPPTVDPSGAGLRANVSGELVAPAAGDEVTIKLRNAHATAY